MSTTNPDGTFTVTNRNGNATTYRTLTADDLADGHPVRAQVVAALESWAPNFMSDAGRVSSYDDWLEKAVDGMWLAGETSVHGTAVYADLGADTSVAPYTLVKKIAQAVAKDLR